MIRPAIMLCRRGTMICVLTKDPQTLCTNLFVYRVLCTRRIAAWCIAGLISLLMEPRRQFYKSLAVERCFPRWHNLQLLR